MRFILSHRFVHDNAKRPNISLRTVNSSQCFGWLQRSLIMSLINQKTALLPSIELDQWCQLLCLVRWCHRLFSRDQSPDEQRVSETERSNELGITYGYFWTCAIQQNVASGKITMNNFAFVQVIHSVCDANQQLQLLFGGQNVRHIEQFRVETESVAEFHHENHRCAVLGGAKCFDNIRVVRNWTNKWLVKEN